jgi:hypothetical protein
MITVKCPECRGGRTITGIGGMVRDCDKCKGVGHVCATKDEFVEKVMGEKPRRGKLKRASNGN